MDTRRTSRAARDWPQLNFLIYHSCLRPAFFPMEAIDGAKPSRLRNGVPDVRGTTEFVDLARDLSNVYAEIGTTWASTGRRSLPSPHTSLDS